MKQPKSLQPSIYKDCSDLYIWELSKTGFYNIFLFKNRVERFSFSLSHRQYMPFGIQKRVFHDTRS